MIRLNRLRLPQLNTSIDSIGLYGPSASWFNR